LRGFCSLAKLDPASLHKSPGQTPERSRQHLQPPEALEPQHGILPEAPAPFIAS